MREQTADQLTFDFIPRRAVVVKPEGGAMTSDAGLLPLRQFDERWGYTARLAGLLADTRRDPEHPVVEMVRQRLLGILADDEDCNDHDDLRSDPVFKLVAGRSLDAPDLASQPTLSRFENAIDTATLQRLIDFTIDTGVERLAGRQSTKRLPSRVTLDIDAFDDPTHGRQQLSLYHGYPHGCRKRLIEVSPPAVVSIASLAARNVVRASTGRLRQPLLPAVRSDALPLERTRRLGLTPWTRLKAREKR